MWYKCLMEIINLTNLPRATHMVVIPRLYLFSPKFIERYQGRFELEDSSCLETGTSFNVETENSARYNQNPTCVKAKMLSNLWNWGLWCAYRTTSLVTLVSISQTCFVENLDLFTRFLSALLSLQRSARVSIDGHCRKMDDIFINCDMVIDKEIYNFKKEYFLKENWYGNS